MALAAFFQISPAVVWIGALAANASQFVNRIYIQAAIFVQLEVITHLGHQLLHELRTDVPPQHHHHHRVNPVFKEEPKVFLNSFQTLKSLGGCLKSGCIEFFRFSKPTAV